MTSLLRLNDPANTGRRLRSFALDAMHLGGPHDGAGSHGHGADLRPLAGLLTFATIIPMAMFVAVYADRLFRPDADVGRLAVLYGGILLAVIVGMSWFSAIASRLRMRHFLLLIIPFLPFLSVFVMQTDAVWLGALLVSCGLQFAVDLYMHEQQDSVSALFRYIRLILVAMLGIAFIVIMGFGLFA